MNLTSTTRLGHFLAAFICSLAIGHAVLTGAPAHAQGNVPGGQGTDLSQPQPLPPDYKQQVEREAAQSGLPPPTPGKITPAEQMPPPVERQKRPREGRDGKPPRPEPGAAAPGFVPPGGEGGAQVPMGQPSMPALPGAPQSGGQTGVGVLPPPAPVPALKPGEMLFNFQDADIHALVKTMSAITGRNFLIDPRVKGKVTIISSKPVQKAAAYQIFLSALKAQGFSAVEGPAGVIKVIPEAEAKQGAWLSSTDPARSDEWITHVVSLQNVSAAQMVQLLRPMMSPHALISPYSPTNTLIITDTASSIRNILQVLEQMDKASSGEVTVIPLKHASANDIAQLIGRLDAGSGAVAPVPGQVAVPGQSGGDLRFILIPDARTNSLLVRGDNVGRIEQLRSLVAKLDVPARVGGNTRVVALRNAEAVKIAELLRGLMAGEARTSSSAPSGFAASAPPGLPGGPASAPAAAPRAIVASLIQADEATNSLIISASDAEYNNLRAVIDKLDVRRAQVFVEALIAEVTVDKSAQFGIQWTGATLSGSTGVTGGVVDFSSNPIGVAASLLDPLRTFTGSPGLNLGFLGGKVILADGTEVFGLSALARAFESKDDFNILSTPNLLTLDNVEAKIVIGQNVPFLTGSFTNTGTTGTTGAVNPFQTIERKDVGLTLKIKPQISEGGGVKMLIAQEQSSVVQGSAASAQGLTTNKRSIDTTVIVDDGHIIVLGGLIEEQVTENVSSIPLLGKLPLIGDLFTFRDRTKKKTNLMVFLRPVIVRSADDALAFTQERYEYMRFHEQKSAMDRHLILPRYAPPTLPEYRQPAPKPAPQLKDEIVSGETKDAKPANVPAPSVAAPPVLDSAPQPVVTPPGMAPPAPALSPPASLPVPVAPSAPPVTPSVDAPPAAPTVATPPPSPPETAAPALP